jgi:hypothetical protein
MHRPTAAADPTTLAANITALRIWTLCTARRESLTATITADRARTVSSPRADVA